MDKKTYKYTDLASKYGGFRAPECKITIGSFTFTNSEVCVPEVEVGLAADGTAGGCRILVADKYDYKSTKWDSKLTDALKVGTKLSISLGYIKTVEVFYGYVDDFTIIYSSETGPRISITGMDGLGYLMSVRSRSFAGKKKIGEFVKSLLNDAVSAGAAKKVTVGSSISDVSVQRIVEGEDSYTFLNTLARQAGVSVFCIDGEIIFDNVVDTTAELTSLEYGIGLHSFSKRLCIANQPGKVIVHGRDVNNAPIKGEATSTKLKGNGRSASETAFKLVKKSVYEEENSMVQTADECNKLAQNRFDELALNYVSGTGECVGIPELIPGRYIGISGVDKICTGSYFITNVVHILDSEGYKCQFEVKGAKSN